MADEHELKPIMVDGHSVQVHRAYDTGKANLLQHKIQRLEQLLEGIERYSASYQAESAELVRNVKTLIFEGETLYSEGFSMQSPEDYSARVDAFMPRANKYIGETDL